MSYRFKFLSLSLISMFGLSLVQCTSAGERKPYYVDGSWSNAMQNMAKNLEELLPFVFSRDEFRNSKNQATVQKLVDRFADGVEEVPKHVGEDLLGKDPIVRYAINGLRSNTRQARRAFKEGELEFSRNVLRESVGLCFTCHSTQNFGPQNNFSTAALGSQFRMSANERAEYYVATRQFDRAIEALDDMVQSPRAMLEKPQEQMAALRKYLFLQVRIKDSPGPAIALLDKYLAWDRLPFFIAQDATVWRQSLRDWQSEKPTEKAPVVKARKLIEKASRQHWMGLETGLIDYLRASSLLHTALRNTNGAKDKAQIYQLLGESYETLAEVGVWEMPDVYYEACVRTLPKSAEAQKCYKNFERSVILGFSGSGGIDIPVEIRTRMEELRKLSGLKVSDVDHLEETVPLER